MKSDAMKLIQGNEACALGALQAGCTFFAGYPITPASEIMETMARELPKKDGRFIQMEDEIGSLAAVIGASWAGAKAMTATSGPGFSLMQEHVGYASMTETPCVIVNSQRGGPSTGLPTLPSQGDVMQARWGTHGDHPVIVLTASSVQTTYEMTIEAFNMSEKFRIPVILLLDAIISHMRENITFPEMEITNRKRPGDPDEFKPFFDETFLAFGEGSRKLVTGLGHDEKGFPETTNGTPSEDRLKKAFERLNQNLDTIVKYDHYYSEDADFLIISYGITSRAAKAAVDKLQAKGISTGMIDLQTLWPFPTDLIHDLSGNVEGILVPEMNLGQMVMPIRMAVEGRAPVQSMNRADGRLFQPDQIVDEIQKMQQNRDHHISKTKKSLY
ncbi:MAG TPA: 2-oxoacid:acceptor oxidoreductase subunit alpha [Balneolaceae bacterium]|nr:2-oxoacid:acceptor oxidoreductase subunit alpha [Balneolaceae bacterium]